MVERAAKKVDVANQHQLGNKKSKNVQYRRGNAARYFILETSGRIGPDAMNLIDEYARMNILPHDPKLVEARRSRKLVLLYGEGTHLHCAWRGST